MMARTILFLLFVLYPTICSAQLVIIPQAAQKFPVVVPPCPDSLAPIASSSHRPMVVLVALDDSFESRLLKAELTRDWLKSERGDRRSACYFQGMAAQLRRDFLFNFDPDAPPGLKRPAIKIGSGPWDILDRRIFRYSTLPLKSICWYRDFAFMESQGYWDWDSVGHVRYKPTIPQAPWLPAGEVPQMAGIIKPHETQSEYCDENDNSP